MNETVFLPGFALKSSMYTRLDVFDESMGIEITPNHSWDTTVENLSESIASKSLVVGYSLGARLALGLALESPELVKGLILISCNAGLTEEKIRQERISEDRELATEFLADSESAFSSFDSNSIFEQDSYADELQPDRIEDLEVIAEQLNILGLGNMPNYAERLNELRKPVLYLSGSRDSKYTELNAKYKKKTPFSHHRVLDSDHRVVHSNPLGTSLCVEWFSKNLI